ncbi:glycoside hydrolase family 2 TIM barrel-domain containing protein [Niabella beijingensis]|uniref:glycoside hydrolase family 2 TIM barrel-domain containing protein n=1 Tax=Niabella beijingensis TaxID=2872700 RepID=UPI001CBE9728|nr:glycoside hydrolase family 2 TIM barrel-domain containing protein [Niabella beijingensis]MBZ4190171.1 hypothetical protein [Niabella beijingensis]
MKKGNAIITASLATLFLFACQKKNVLVDPKDTALSMPAAGSLANVPRNVQIVNQSGTWKMLVDGSSYFIKGAAVSNKLPNRYWFNINAYGANSIRQYSVDADTQGLLDSAQLKGLTVILCLYAKHESDGFDYNDTAAVNLQLQDFKYWVQQYRNHPALLMWAIGNELNSGYSNLKCWDAVDAISRMIHAEDPNHPTSTILSGSSITTLNNVALRAPDLDCVGINAYSALGNVHNNVLTSNINKPYYIGEFGPAGTWESHDTTSFGTLHEKSSTSKANDYKSKWGAYIDVNMGHACLGGYAFVLGYQRQGAVPMWYGMRSRENRAFGALEALQYQWTGAFPSNRAPQIAGSRNHITLGGKTEDDNVTLTAGQNYTGNMIATDPEGDPIAYEWTVVKEKAAINPDLSVPGTYPGLPGTVSYNPATNTVTVTAPATAGKYRLYGFAKDDHNHIASACLPFRLL